MKSKQLKNYSKILIYLMEQRKELLIVPLRSVIVMKNLIT